MRRVAQWLRLVAPPVPLCVGRRPCLVDELQAVLDAEQAPERQAQAVLDRAAPAEFEGFRELADAVASAHSRDRVALAQVEQVERAPRSGGRGHGLEWAFEELFISPDRTRQASALLRALAPHEAEIRALLQRAA